MYKLYKYLFGWDYIYWENTADHGIARVRQDQTGQPYYYRYSFCTIIDKILKPSQVMWLTCKPSKFAPPDQSFGIEISG